MSTEQARYALYGTIALLYASLGVTSWLSGIAIDLWSLAQFLGHLFLLVPIMAYARVRHMHPLDTVIETIVCGLAIVHPLLFLTYAAMGAGFPLADQQLLAWDVALGFDWEAFVLAVDSSRFASLALQYAYSSFSIQLLLIPIYFAFAGKAKHAYAFIFAYLVTNAVASAVGVFFPALSAYPTSSLVASELHNINANFGFQFLDQFHAVRGAEPFIFRLNEAQGILTFPSMHAGGALICAWMAWKSPYLRLPLLVLNILMATSALTHGSHYLVDLFMGIALALGVVILTDRLFGLRRERSGLHPAQQVGADGMPDLGAATASVSLPAMQTAFLSPASKT